MVKMVGGSGLQLAEAGREDDSRQRSLRVQYLPSLEQGSPLWWGRFPSTPRMCWAVGQEELLFSGEWQVELQAPSPASITL